MPFYRLEPSHTVVSHGAFFLYRAIFTNTSGIFFSRILGFLRDLITASVLGAGIYSDVFFVAFKLPNLFRRIFGEGAFAQAFLPSFIHTRYKGAFSIAIFIRFMIAIMLLSLLTVFLDFYITKTIAFGFNPELIALATPLVAINIWYLDAIFIVTFLAALLQYKNHFATTAFSTALLNIALIAALLLSQNESGEEIIFWMSVAVVAGGVMQVAVHLLALRNKGLIRMLRCGVAGLESKRARYRDDVKKFYKQFFPAVLGASTAQISAFLDTFLASFLMSGSISYLYYGNRIFQLPLALFAIAVSTALFPTVARALKNREEKKALTLMKKAVWALLLLLTPSMIGGIMLDAEIMWLLFERGEFTREDSFNSGFVMAMYLIGLLPFGLAKLFSLWLYSKGEQAKAARYSAQSLGINIVLSLALIGPMGAAGLALASSLSGFFLLYWTLQRFGWSRVWDIIRDKKGIALVFLLGVEIALITLLLDFYSIGTA